MRRSIFPVVLLVLVLAAFAGCRQNMFEGQAADPTALKNVPSVRLNFRYEADVPAPVENMPRNAPDARNSGVQADFDTNRTQEVLDRTIVSPDGKRVLVLYHRPTDLPAEFRLDMYSPDGTFLRKVTADTMAVHFPDTIRWSPDSSTAAFVAMIRGVTVEDPSALPNPELPGGQPAAPNANANAGAPANANVETTDANTSPVDESAQTAQPSPPAPTGILAFRTEQIYTCNAEGSETKPITQNEGLIYFYYVWAPNSSALVALAATAREWQVLNSRADLAGEIFTPVGRPRVVERSGRERRLDDNLTAVQPVWSPDSAKIASAFQDQVRIYDAGGNAPTQAAIPLRNHLLISSQAFDREQQSKLNAANTETQPDPANAQAPTVLPDPSTLVSFNPIVAMSWPSEDLLYFQTAFIKRMKNESDSVTSFPRWHRLVLTPQPAAQN